jgi:peroxiredoxin
MMFIEVVFSINECAAHVLQIYEKHNEFQALNCDILLLTKSGDGGGFLKLVGVPFRLLLDEEQSLARILQHRQSAVSIAGRRQITLVSQNSFKKMAND